jgi:predicted nicotinamide N-methyase
MLPDQLQRAMYGFIESASLFAAYRCGLLGQLAATEGAMTASHLAEATSLTQELAERILNANCAAGVVVQVPGLVNAYSLAGPMRDYFPPTSPRFVGNFIDHLATQTFPAAAGLADAIRRPTVAEMPNAEPAAGIFAAIYSDDSKAAAFLDAMWNLGASSARELVQDPVFAQAKQLVDLGGGPGHFAIAAAEQHAGLEASVYDLAPVARHFDGYASRSDARTRLRFIAGDFWSDDLPPADLYALGYVLSDWKRGHCVELLRRIHSALPPGGHVLIAEKLFDPGRHSPYSTLMLDIAMLLETEGQHRTAEGYQELLRDAGFTPVRVRRSSEEKHLIIGRKAG